MIFRRDCGLCQECLRQGNVTSLKLHAQRGQLTAHVDHIKPHNGDQQLFNDEANLETLCATCHSRKTAGEDGGFGRVFNNKTVEHNDTGGRVKSL